VTHPPDDDQHGPELDLRRLAPLSPDECRQLLRSRRVGRVVFVDTRGPVALPVNYVLDHDDVIFRTEAWSSLHATPASGRVSFEVDEIDEHERIGWSILARGTVHRIDDPAELRHVMRLHPEPWARGAHDGERDEYLRLSVETVTGRRLVVDDPAG
jgi:nitroimidazol reductase NimA-like FMN-containing flavoprotein (pyridoxamine 5'-phosphate oxidase superfamily)